MREIYLDNAATTPMSPKVIDIITNEMKNDFQYNSFKRIVSEYYDRKEELEINI